MKRGLSILVIGCILLSCSKNEDFGPQYSNPPNSKPSQVLTGALVLNEGNFGFGNSSLSVIDFSNNGVQNKVFESANAKKIGDVGQSILVIDSLAFIAVNNSNKIEVINLTNFKEVKEIKVSGAPRYMVKYNNSILISTMGANSVLSLNLFDFSISNNIKVSGWLEEMIIKEDVLYACNRTTHTVDVVELSDGTLKSRISVGKDPESIVIDSSGIVWVLCTGGFNVHDQEKASLYKIVPPNAGSEMVYQFSDIQNSPTRLRLNRQGTSVYFLNNGVYRFNLRNRGIPELVLKQSQGALYYGLTVKPMDGNLLVTNAKDYVSSGEVLEIDANSTLIQQYNVGVIPQFIGFY